ncbi:beta-1,2-xylosyltransferase RCN11-like [Pecten maximus]|uniref:beta-1,2-xylosyltransferase RCN11-like n=1 Tax=Pecten maximus TaxID=6579 RepID=UPI0014581546|nr:beta-1,2-xylosyltransferase RCN11-like [Pecten maximus]
MKSRVRIHVCCKWMYIAMLTSLAILITLELHLYADLRTKTLLQKSRRGRQHRAILESSHSHYKRKHGSSRIVKSKVANDIDEKMNKRIFRSHQRVEQTLDMVLERVKSGKEGSIYCDGNLEVFNLDIVLMKNVLIDARQQKSKLHGGETIKQVIGEKESSEVVTLKPGFFRIPCASMPLLKFSPKSHFSNWYLTVSEKEVDIPPKSTHISNFTVFVKRGDYANMYWTLIELYNTYMTIRLFGKDPKTTSVVLVDAHPQGKLDSLWTLLFGKVIRVRSLRGDIFIKEVTWVIPLSSSPIGQAIPNLPFIREFKSTLYKAVGINSVVPICERGLNHTVITLILRHDYVAHPRNPSGKVSRKITNEKELVKHLDRKFPGGRLNAVQLDQFSIKDQIRIIYNTSVLVGVHGAGLAYTLLLRPGAAMFEMFPLSYKKSPNWHFQQFAVWGGCWYERWISKDKSPKSNEWIRIPTEVPEHFINKYLHRMCNLTSTYS